MTSRPAATARSRFSAIASWSGSPGGRDCRSSWPASLKTAMQSMWPSVSRSSTSPSPSQTTSVTPRYARRASSMAARSRSGFRLGLSRHCSVVTRRPSPSTMNEPPSSTIGASKADIAVPLGEGATGGLVPVPAGELLAPGVEAEVDAGPTTRAVQGEGRPAVAHPRVVERELHQLDGPGEHGPGLGGGTVGHHHGHRFEGGDGVGDLGEVLACRRQLVPPELASGTATP